jgi:hypothetical protein
MTTPSGGGARSFEAKIDLPRNHRRLSRRKTYLTRYAGEVLRSIHQHSLTCDVNVRMLWLKTISGCVQQLVMDVGVAGLPSPLFRRSHAQFSRRTKKHSDLTRILSSVEMKIRLEVQTLVSKKLHACFQSNSRAVALYQTGKIIPIPTLHEGMRQLE